MTLRSVDEDFMAERTALLNREAEIDPPLSNLDEGGTSGPMDPWKQSVEARLASLDNRLGRVEPNIEALKVDVAVIKATMATKTDLTDMGTKLAGKMQLYLGLVAALIVIASAIVKFV